MPGQIMFMLLFHKKYCSSLKDSTVIKLKHTHKNKKTTKKLKHYFTCAVLTKFPWIQNKHFHLCTLPFLILQYLSFPIFFGHVSCIIHLKILESRISIFCMSFPPQLNTCSSLSVVLELGLGWMHSLNGVKWTAFISLIWQMQKL